MKSIAVSCNGNGDNTLITGITGYRFRVHAFLLVSASAVNGTLYDGASSGGTAFTGAMPLASPLSAPPGGNKYDPIPYFETLTAGNDLVLKLSSNVQVSGFLIYDIIK